jgi:hypothetical protein
VKKVNFLTKQEEQEELLINLICKIENPELKSEYLVKLKKLLTKEEPSKEKTSKPPISLSKTLENFNRLKSKEVTIQDLQQEVNQIKSEIRDLK